MLNFRIDRCITSPHGHRIKVHEKRVKLAHELSALRATRVRILPIRTRLREKKQPKKRNDFVPFMPHNLHSTNVCATCLVTLSKAS